MNEHNVSTADRQEEACGVFAVYAPGEDVARVTYFGLYALQHRGQESAGIAASSGDGLFVIKDVGLLNQVFKESSFASLQGDFALGHVRYSTTGSNHWESTQPVYVVTPRGPVAVAQNGTLVNAAVLRAELEAKGVEFTAETDTELIGVLLENSDAKTSFDAIREIFPKLAGAYSIVIMTENGLIAARDPSGFRPLSIGRKGDQRFFVSETAALDVVGATLVRDVEPGEMVMVGPYGFTSSRFAEPKNPSLCIFEYIYFARPDSILNGRTLYEARKEMGMFLAEEAPVDADVVIPVPDSGVPAAIGFAERSGIPYGHGLIKNRYIGRTFIQPSQSIRQLGVRLKLNPLSSVIEGKKLVVIDDSIVRGTTSRKIANILKEAGAAEVHMRICSPPARWPCFYGIDMTVREDLIASAMTVPEIAESLGVDSLAYLSLDNLVRACRLSKDRFCTACFDGEYPIEVPQESGMSKYVLEKDGS